MRTNRNRIWWISGCLVVSGWFSARALPPDEGGSVPQDYRKWTHVSSTVIGPKSAIFGPEGGIHHIYANDGAVEGLKSGKYRDGSAFVYDLLEIKELEGVTKESTRRRLDLMIKDGKGGKDSGNWVFRRFMGDNWREDVLKPEERDGCFQCHTRRKGADYVFSVYRN
jgi:Cytochrome P460